MMEEIKVLNRGKIAFLYCRNIFEQRIEKIYIDNKEQYVFVFKGTEEFFEAVEEFNKNKFLKLYNKEFKNIAFTISKLKRAE